MDRRFVLGRKRVDRREAVVASKDQIQQVSDSARTGLKDERSRKERVCALPRNRPTGAECKVSEKVSVYVSLASIM